MLSGTLMLPADVLLVPVGELTEETRRQLRWQAGDHAITRPRLRTPSRLVDAGAVELLRQFASPSTVVEAVIRHSQARGEDPEATLDAAYPLLVRLVREGFLVSAADGGAVRIEASWREGDRLAGFTVLCCVQVLEDTEVYQVRGGGGSGEAAIKIERRLDGAERRSSGGGAGEHPLGRGGGERPAAAAAGRGAAARLVREAAILDHLGRAARRPPVAPRLLGAGSWADRRFVALEWCSGVDASTAAEDLREDGVETGRAALLALCRAVVDAYAELHASGVLHCDVHPRNVLVAADGSVRLIDFGLASWRGEPAGLPPVGRGGVPLYLEPEHAAAMLAGVAAPAATAAGEQYAVAVLLYQVAAGAPYLDFSLERDTLLRQIAEDAPLPFAARGADAWPELEAVLGRALAKAPGDRFPTLAAFAGALKAVEAGRASAGAGRVAADAATAAPPPTGSSPSVLAAAPVVLAAAPVVLAAAPVVLATAPADPGSSPLSSPVPVPSPLPPSLPSLTAALRRGGPGEELLADTLAWVRPGGPLWTAGLGDPPFASVQFGSAGIAYALYRMAMARDDPELLSQADLWAVRASAAAARVRADGARDGGEDGAADESGRREPADPAFYNPDLDVTPESVGQASLFHTEPGVRCTQALIANALGDGAGVAEAVAAFIAAARRPCPGPDLTLGRSGLLLGCALLLGAVGSPRPAGETATPPEGGEASRGGATPTPSQRLQALGDELLAGLWQEIDELPPIAACAERPNLGIAHGWAGYLYASLRWCHAAGRPSPGRLAARLDELGGTAESWGRGARWRWHGQPLGEGHRRVASETARWMAGWCNGSAGMVHLWTLAARLLDSRRACQLASAAAWHAWEASERLESLCCGLAGRAYALLDLYQHGAGAEWLARARTLAARATAAAGTAAGSGAGFTAASAASTTRGGAAGSAASGRRGGAAFEHSLYRGRLGVALLAADLESPEAAAMPLFGDEGWPAA